MSSNANVQVTLTVNGNDRASAAINKAKDAVEATGLSLKGATKHADSAQKAISGITAIAGGLPGPLGQAAQAAGGLKSVLEAVPGPIGLAAAAVTVLGGAIAFAMQQAKAAAKERAEAEKARLAELLKEPALLADSLGVSRQLLGVTEMVALVQDRARKAAQDSLDLQNQRQDALLDNDKDRARELQARIANHGQLLQRLDAELQAQQKLAAEEKARAAAEAAHQAAIAQIIGNQREAAELRVSNILDKREQLRVRSAAALASQRRIEEDAASAALKYSGDALAVELSRIEAARERNTADLRAIAGEGEALRNQRVSRGAAAGRARTDERNRQARAEVDFAIRQAEREAAEFDAHITEVEGKRQQVIESRARLLSAQIASVGDDPALRASLEMMQLQQDRMRMLERVHAETADGTQARLLQLAAVEQEVANKRAAISAKEIADSKAKAAEARAEMQAKQDMALGVASAAVAGLEQIGVAEQAAAGLKAILAAAEAALAFTRGRYDQAVAGAFAAVQFGRIALGGGAPTSPVSASGGSAPSAYGSAQSPASTAGNQAGGGTYIFNYNGGFGTKQEVGKALSSSLKSLSGTGLQLKTAV